MSEFFREAKIISEFKPKSDEKRLKFCIVSKHNECERFDFDIGRYIEELSIKGAKFDNLKTMFKDHIVSVDNAIAKVENIRIENDEIVCECVFDRTSAYIYEKFKSGILSDVSIGYRVLDSEISKKNNKKYMFVREYEIFELSAVWKGADKGANLRDKTQDEFLAKSYIEIEKEKLNLKEKILWMS